jgi:hypothetical protein
LSVSILVRFRTSLAMNFRRLSVYVCLTALICSSGWAADEARFSKAIAPSEISQIGLDKLSSDQIAVLDALVRKDATAATMVRKDKPRANRFSERLSDDERRNAGLTLLDEPMVLQLDQRIEKFIAPPAVDGGSYSLGSRPASTIYTARSLRREPEIHGSISLVYGVGSHGYSERGGAMTLSYEDPENRFAVAVGYSEMHVKGDYVGRYCRDGFSRWPGDPWW